MDETPDFEALARLWLGRDPRSENLPQDAREKIVARLAEALKKRRSSTDHLTKFLQERIDNSEDL